MSPDNLSARGKRFFRLIEFDDQEKLIAEIRKHPFGLALIYITGTTVAVLLFSILVLGGVFMQSDPLGLGVDTGSLRSILVVVGFLLTLLSFGITAIGAYLYQSNVILITSQKLAQLLNTSIFDRKISQLSIGDVQDVTVSQKGIFARMFNYGTLTIETAGEQENYTFTFTPNPYESGKLIVGAHEQNLIDYGN